MTSVTQIKYIVGKVGKSSSVQGKATPYCRQLHAPFSHGRKAGVIEYNKPPLGQRRGWKLGLLSTRASTVARQLSTAQQWHQWSNIAAPTNLCNVWLFAPKYYIVTSFNYLSFTGLQQVSTNFCCRLHLWPTNHLIIHYPLSKATLWCT